MSDKASSLQAIFSGLFAGIAPILSGTLAEEYGYKTATNTIAVLAITSGIMFYRSYSLK